MREKYTLVGQYSLPSSCHSFGCHWLSSAFLLGGWFHNFLRLVFALLSLLGAMTLQWRTQSMAQSVPRALPNSSVVTATSWDNVSVWHVHHNIYQNFSYINWVGREGFWHRLTRWQVHPDKYIFMFSFDESSNTFFSIITAALSEPYAIQWSQRRPYSFKASSIKSSMFSPVHDLHSGMDSSCVTILPADLLYTRVIMGYICASIPRSENPSVMRANGIVNINFTNCFWWNLPMWWTRWVVLVRLHP